MLTGSDADARASAKRKSPQHQCAAAAACVLRSAYGRHKDIILLQNRCARVQCVKGVLKTRYTSCALFLSTHHCALFQISDLECCSLNLFQLIISRSQWSRWCVASSHRGHPLIIALLLATNDPHMSLFKTFNATRFHSIHLPCAQAFE